MQNYSFIFSLFLMTFLATAGFAQSEKIVGKWQIDIEKMEPKLKAAFEKETGANGDSTQQVMMQQMLASLVESLGQTTMQFNSDGTFESFSVVPMQNREENKVGTWRYEEGFIYTKIEGQEDENSVKVEEVTSDKLVIAGENANGPLKEIVLFRAD